MEEIFDLVRQEIVRSGYEDNIASGVVLTGGMANLEGTTEMAEQIFDFPVVRATPRGVGGLVDVVNSPIYTTGVGLVLCGYHKKQQLQPKNENVYVKVKKKMGTWLGDVF
ncbi:MAG: Cell division protein FtsA [uncultured bacterium]|nr:MAG: Cell division protein FtsA [uncultured bacterium]